MTEWTLTWVTPAPDPLCATCGVPAVGTFNDGSPRFPGACDHPPIQSGDPRMPGELLMDAAEATAPAFAEVELTEAGWSSAGEHATEAIAAAKRYGYSMKFQPAGGETVHQVNHRGYAAELCGSAATGLGLRWEILKRGYRRRDKRPDLGARTDVRNARKPDGRLWTDGDRVDWVYLSVVGPVAPRTFLVKGWLEGRELMVPERWEVPPKVLYPAWFADQRELHPLPMPEDA